jgi:hypothetical protein
MNRDAEMFWKSIAPGIRKARGMSILSADEAEKWMATNEGDELSEGEVRDILQAALGGERPCSEFERNEWSGDFACEDVAEEFLVLNRNAGEEDQAVQEELDELRKELLEDNGDEKDELEGGKKPSR